METKPGAEAPEKQVQNLKKRVRELESQVLKLSENLEQRNKILDHLPDHVLIQDHHHRIRWANQTACQSLKRSREGVLGRKCHEIWNQSPEPCADCPAPRCLETGKWESVERSTPDGRTWRVRCFPLRRGGDESPLILEVAEDISETVKSREARCIAEKHRALILDTMGEMLAYYDTELRVQWASRAAAESVGAEVRELVGRHCYAIWQGRDRPCDGCPVLEAMRTGQPRQREVSTPDGRLYNLRGYPVFDEQGELIGTVEYGFDITDRKQAEAALEASEKKFRLIFQNAGYGIATADENGNLTDANPVFCRLLGYSRQELLGKNFSDFTLSQYHQYEFEQVEKIYRGEISGYSFEKQYQTKGGKAIWGYLSVTANRDEQGNIIGFIGTVVDITERKQTEKQLRQLQKSESLGRMAGAVAHHFNNTLTAVIGNLEMAEADLSPELEGFENIIQARAAADQACQMSQLMLTYLGHQRTKSRPLDLSETCLRYLETLRSEIPAGVGLQKVLPIPGPVIHADLNQIEKVIKALVTNAWEAMEKNHLARIKVSTSTVLASEIQKDRRFQVDWKPTAKEYAALRVTDTGRGIPPESMEKLFDPFFSDKFTGRGLGLAVALGMVKAHGGCITVKSTPGAGSCFTVYLPLSGKTV